MPASILHSSLCVYLLYFLCYHKLVNKDLYNIGSLKTLTLYVGWSDVAVICGQISMLCGNTAYCVKLSGEVLSRCSNEIESVCENIRVITILLRKWYHNNKRVSELASHNGGKTAGIDMAWRNYVTVTLCIPVSSQLPNDDNLTPVTSSFIQQTEFASY